MIPLIILNLVLAFVGAFINRIFSIFSGPVKSDVQAALGGAVGTLLINVVLWLGYTTGAGFLLVLSVTFPSFLLGAGLAVLWNRRVKKSGN